MKIVCSLWNHGISNVKPGIMFQLRGGMQPHLHPRSTPILNRRVELDVTRTLHILNSVKSLQ